MDCEGGVGGSFGLNHKGRVCDETVKARTRVRTRRETDISRGPFDKRTPSREETFRKGLEGPETKGKEVRYPVSSLRSLLGMGTRKKET